MTDQQLELELRAWFRAEIPAVESAPTALRTAVASIPATTIRRPVGIPLPRSRRRLSLLAIAAVLIVATLGVIAAGNHLWLPIERSPAPTESLEPSSPLPIFTPRAASWTPAAPMLEPRAGDLYGRTTWAVLLADGRVLVAGGDGDDRLGASVLSSAEIYDPATNTWRATAPMTTPRTGQTMTRLGDGRVLVVGGTAGAPEARLTTAELFDPSSGSWAATGSLHEARAYHTATLLSDGRVLVAGGDLADACAEPGCDPNTGQPAEIYDPATSEWTFTGPMGDQRVTMAATLLSDGRVLLLGGGRLIGLHSAQVFDPATAQWLATTDMIAGRNNAAAVLLADGRVLVVGGQVKVHQADPNVTAEIYDPIASTWIATADYPGFLPLGSVSATLLSNGQVEVFGAHGPYLFDPEANDWAQSTSGLLSRAAPMQLKLADGRILVAGGLADGRGPAMTAVDIYDPGTGP